MTNRKTGNEPAFASSALWTNGKPTRTQTGMTKREYYAAHCPLDMKDAWEAWQLVPWHINFNYKATDRPAFFKWLAQARFEYADAMIAAGESEDG